MLRIQSFHKKVKGTQWTWEALRHRHHTTRPFHCIATEADILSDSLKIWSVAFKTSGILWRVLKDTPRFSNAFIDRGTAEEGNKSSDFGQRYEYALFWEPFYWHGLVLNPVRISNYSNFKVWDEITYPYPNFNRTTVKIKELIVSKLIPHLTEHVITCPSFVGLKLIHVSKRAPSVVASCRE